MPLYDFKCPRCQVMHELFHPHSAPPPMCPDCSSAVMERMLSAPAGKVVGVVATCSQSNAK